MAKREFSRKNFGETPLIPASLFGVVAQRGVGNRSSTFTTVSRKAHARLLHDRSDAVGKKIRQKPSMSQEPNAVEAAITRALRENLERIQRASEELNHAVADVVAACGSNKPTNALPPMLRAQTSAASLAAGLEVLARFIAITLQPGPRSPLEAEMSRLASAIATQQVPATSAAVPPVTAPEPAHPAVGAPKSSAPAHAEPTPTEPGPAEIEEETIALESPAASEASAELESEFDVSRLSSEEQELHRRANRVAKVSMQDIKMLRPDQVRQGRQNKDLCIRLKDDIEKAHREYERRFKSILDHPVDYFHRWMVEVLADGDAGALGDYPYATTARPH